MQEHHLLTQRTARYYTIGEISKSKRTVWIACHGYAMLAGEFIKGLEPLAEKGRGTDDESRDKKNGNVLIVAPEALSRFYTKGFYGTVGATWMTREDRLAEIDDYAGYLQLLYEKIKSQVHPKADIHILGFSQGCSTVCRWIARKSPVIKALWLCSGSIPEDLDFKSFKRATQNYAVRLIIGDKDPFISAVDKEAVLERIRANGLEVEAHEFKGGHDLNLPLVKSLMSSSKK